MVPFFRRRVRPSGPAAAPPPSGDLSSPPEEPAAAHAWLCEHLPLLREEAGEQGWRRELEEQVAAVREGRPANEALDALLLSAPGPSRGPGEVPLLRDVWDQAPIGQRFHCPRAICPPRGRRQDASEPWCHINDQPLHPTTYRLD